MSWFKIKGVECERILDSRGVPTLKTTVYTDKFAGSASVPSGASTGKNEAFELRDKDKDFFGKDVKKAMQNVKKISVKIRGLDCREQEKIDEIMSKLDGTPNKKKLGANAILSVSMAIARCAANAYGMELFEYLKNHFEKKYSGKKNFLMPVPFANIINGGKHAGNSMAFQEFMIVPHKARNFREAAKITSEVYQKLREILANKYGKQSTGLGDEGGFAPPIKDPEEAILLMKTALKETGHSGKAGIALDCAATEFFHSGEYLMNEKIYSGEELNKYYIRIAKKHRILSIEDPFQEEDFEMFSKLKKESKIQIVGDDLTVTNSEIIKRAVLMDSINCVLIKPNQIGTLTEVFEAVKIAHGNNLKTMVSHRSGETTDSFISDLAVALGCGQIKIGAPARGERVAKYNRLLEIEKILGVKARYNYGLCR